MGKNGKNVEREGNGEIAFDGRVLDDGVFAGESNQTFVNWKGARLPTALNYKLRLKSEGEGYGGIILGGEYKMPGRIMPDTVPFDLWPVDSVDSDTFHLNYVNVISSQLSRDLIFWLGLNVECDDLGGVLLQDSKRIMSGGRVAERDRWYHDELLGGGRIAHGDPRLREIFEKPLGLCVGYLARKAGKLSKQMGAARDGIRKNGVMEVGK